MSDGFTIELDDAALQRRLDEAAARLADPSDLLQRIGGTLRSNIEGRFDSKLAPDGTPWLPLAPSTVKRYLKKYDGNIPGSLLERTRHMRDSLQQPLVGTGYVEVGFSEPIAAYHETGTRRGLPRRSLLSDDPIAGTLGAQDRDDVLDEVNAYLQQLL
ncbi:MAG: phage virion morphogenesis protein [Ideonella sp.]|nr:phage virion morphogenesis protein [Ideonella sp.]MCC7455982.1 phage virion morphogenesis protein [Nitrospira sp.]